MLNAAVNRNVWISTSKGAILPLATLMLVMLMVVPVAPTLLDIGFDEPQSRGVNRLEIAAAACGEIVHDRHMPPRACERLGQMGADEARPTGDQRAAIVVRWLHRQFHPSVWRATGFRRRSWHTPPSWRNSS